MTARNGVAPRSIFGTKRSRNPVVIALASHTLLIVLLIVMLYPLLWMVVASFRPDNQIFNSLGLWSEKLTLENYTTGWEAGGSGISFSNFFLNSVLVAVFSIAGNLVACSLTAYAFARMQFPLKRTMFAILLATLLLPYQVTLVPQYILFSDMGWINTYLPLIVPRWLGVDAFFIFLMVQFMRTLPRELDDSARIDGAGHWTIFARIVLPLALPALGITALFTFINSWNDFLGPLLYLNSPDLWTVPQGLASFLDATGESSYGGLFAMCTVSLAPLVGFFLVSQRLLVEGLATTGIK